MQPTLLELGPLSLGWMPLQTVQSMHSSERRRHLSRRRKWSPVSASHLGMVRNDAPRSVDDDACLEMIDSDTLGVVLTARIIV